MKHPIPGSFRRIAPFWLGVLAAFPLVHAQDEEELTSVHENMPRIVLDKLVYEEADVINATVIFVEAADAGDAFLGLVYATESSGDVELVKLAATADPRVFVTEKAIQVANNPANVGQDNGVLELAPNEVFSALLSYRLSKRTQKPGQDAFSGDWGILADPGFGASGVEVRPGLALTEDETNSPAGLPAIGTLFFEDEPGPVQVASKRLMFLPESEAQLADFLNRTGGQVVRAEGTPEPVVDPQDLPKAGTEWLLVELAGDPAKIAQLPQLRALTGAQKILSCSNEATLALVATALELWCEGFLVGLEPRMQLQGDLFWPEHEIDGLRTDSFGSLGDNNPNVFKDGNFGIRQSWAYLAMFDYDRARIPVGVIDSGFAPNPDFKTGDAFYFERNLSTGAAGIGSAQTPQEVGNSFFGDKTWHGNGTVTTISGVGGNRYGSAGIGGQVAAPKLYHMGLANFAFGFGTAIRLAVDDGCSVVNISAGYPCRILSVLGNDNICSPEGRAAFALKLGLAVRAAAAAACAASPLLDAFLPGLGTATCATAIAAAETAALGLFATVFLGEIRTPVERAVQYATANGVPVVASAGNRLSDEAIGALGPFVNNENSNIDDWQIIPAVIPDVIAVGCCASGGWAVWNGSGDNHYANIHFWGDSIDIWAPFGTWFWAPENGTADPATIPPSDHIRRTFGGTSNSAPIVTGVICNLMAIDPSLDRRFAPAANLPNLPGQIRDLLVNTAHQAGDPAAPDSADDVMTFAFNPDTEMLEEIDEPAELVTQMMRRRNYLNAWAAVQQAASNVSAFDYAPLGYETDLGRDDRLADIGAPDGVLLPERYPPFTEVEELSLNDREFWYLRTPNTNNLFRIRYEATLPLAEDASSFLLNGAPGTPVSSSGAEQTVAWETPDLWRNAHFPSLIASRWGMDAVYKLNGTLMTFPAPSPDSFDFGFLSNETLDEAAIPESMWENVPPHGLLEVDAFELCIDGLNFHNADDVDVFRIDFPDPPLDLPASCGSLEPWITIRLEPPHSGLRVRVYSRSGGTDRLLARGNGSSSITLECHEYLGRLPLYVMVDSAAGTYAAYALKVRWSEPDNKLSDRLDRIRDANAGPREIPFHEQFFRPEIPWLFTSPGLLPDALVNPNPVIQQSLDQEGRFLASRLFFLEVPEQNNFNIGVLAQFGAGQSLRMELVGLDEQVLGSAATPNLKSQKGLPSAPVDPTQALTLFFQDLTPGIYLLRLSGHRPGDQIALYLSETLNQFGGLSIEALFSQQQQGQFPPTPLGYPAELAEGGLFSLTTFSPPLLVGDGEIQRARQIIFAAEAATGYQPELRDESGIWQPFGSPLVLESPGDTSFIVPGNYAPDRIRIAKLGTPDSFPPEQSSLAIHLRFQSELGIPYFVTGSDSPDRTTFKSFPAVPSFTGTGYLHEWFLDATEIPPPFFFRFED